MADLSPDVVARAIAREPDAVRALVNAISPVIAGRVARALHRRGARSTGRNVAQEVEDLTQEVFVALFADDARALRAWRPERAPLGAFCALVADHQVYSIFRSGKRRPWSNDLVVSDEIEATAPEAHGPEARVASRQAFDALWNRLRSELSPKGLDLFQRLYVEEESVESVCAATAMTADAVYAWRSRLAKLVRRLAAELDDPMSNPDPTRRTPSVEGSAQ